ncbi:hypothetical protein [Solitalea canadensis]|uniref:Lipoprotein n=1 Tax=Solitalea canadensis (strain ATCC 29591 / DSM 3403 / JCM 21819 / LMG 8368 / NBRC 15130 / NCIMB 12057 / USAM 9D) TaxID=929556 RepID=H8KL99_SOLCM|nr:hypothetical protein [Solitalea canadensis]AFD09182.1 hypothetical protein Solca_4192 [Solitalea canadensis DSM 3403]
MRKRCYLIGLSILLFFSCTRHPFDEQQLQAYVSDADNGLIKEQQVKGLDVKVMFRPAGLLIAQELNGQPASEALIDSLKRKYSNHYYFILNLSKNDKEVLHSQGNFSDYSALLQTLSFSMGQYISLTTSSRDTLEMVDYTFDRTYGMSGGNALMFAFSKEKLKESKEVSFNLDEFGIGTGLLHFEFKRKDLNAVPELATAQYLKR